MSNFAFPQCAGRIREADPRAGSVPGSHRRWLLFGVFGLLAVLDSSPALAGGGPQNVLVVIDDAIPDSVAIGEYYVQQRDIPACNVLRISAPTSNTFQDLIDNLSNPIKAYLAAEGIESQIDFIVLTKGFAYAMSGGRDSTASVLFSEVTEPWDGQCDPGSANLKNPYYNKAEFFDYDEVYVLGSAPLMNRRAIMMLSGFTVAGAKNNIDSGVAGDETHPAGTIYMFSAPPSSGLARMYPRHEQIPGTRAALTSLGIASQHAVVASEAQASLSNTTDVMGYLTGAPRVEVLSNTYLPGAVADHLTSFGGDLLNAGGQMSILEFTDAGVAGSSGTVSEPCNFTSKFADALLYERYGVGFSLGESLWMSVSKPWQTIFVGDPLAQPWACKPQVTISTPEDGQVFGSGQIQLEVSATHPSGDFLSRMDLFVDGKYFETLVDLTAVAGNEVTLSVNGTAVSYTTAEGDDCFDVFAGLEDQSSVLPGAEVWIPSQSTGRSGYAKVRAGVAGAASNGFPVSVTTLIGNASEIRVAARLSSATLTGGMNAIATGEVAAARAQSQLFVTVGAPALESCVTVDLSAYPEGPHELRVVAYQGDRIFTQGYAKRTITIGGTVAGDVNGDGIVDLADFLTFVRCFDSGVSEPVAGCNLDEAAASDLNGDGTINLLDFLTFISNFDV